MLTFLKHLHIMTKKMFSKFNHFLKPKKIRILRHIGANIDAPMYPSIPLSIEIMTNVSKNETH